ncbi:MAG: urease accessory protein UreD [Treponema sp.]|nr:urease accessory protein UreD [Treponema sp.]
MNQFGKVSRLELTAAFSRDKKTFIEDSFFTSPFKIMKPFENPDGSIAVFQQSASAGILSGDAQEHNIVVKKNASLKIRSQSFEKIFKMEEGERASRTIFATVQENAALFYEPLPCIPFSQSDFSSRSQIHLSDKSSRLLYQDILCAGRVASGEFFDYRFYRNLIEIWRGEKLVFRDNAFFEGSDGGKKPAAKELLQSPSVFGGFTHSGTLLLFGFGLSVSDARKILGLEEKLLYSETIPAKIVEASQTESGDIAIRALANCAETIQKEFEKIKTALTSWRI